ncbi:PREDICTED: uncharacterized protein LOC105527432 [Colobus angolensis palliatus]|uniref:uncharacterized protein LOC105527432 n=1 Tax=Colobus angolensis palliatus TaxID=336983 RepID=UPI0005F515C9|nr:PREDICTED: uncharacterized protein LOC105527432 [Colobus angolensis palliatus]
MGTGSVPCRARSSDTKRTQQSEPLSGGGPLLAAGSLGGRRVESGFCVSGLAAVMSLSQPLAGTATGRETCRSRGSAPAEAVAARGRARARGQSIRCGRLELGFVRPLRGPGGGGHGETGRPPVELQQLRRLRRLDSRDNDIRKSKLKWTPEQLKKERVKGSHWCINENCLQRATRVTQEQETFTFVPLNDMRKKTATNVNSHLFFPNNSYAISHAILSSGAAASLINFITILL